MENHAYKDWGEVSELFDIIKAQALNKTLENDSEAQTRFDIIDRIIKEVLQWQFGQISVEETSKGEGKPKYVDYILKSGDYKIIVEAKRHGATFPNPSRRKKLKLTGSILNEGEIGDAIRQAEEYARVKEASIVVVTNGSCWCFYPYDINLDRDLIYAHLLFPFDDINDAEELFSCFAIPNVEQDSLSKIGFENPYAIVNSFINSAKDADARIGRNNIADAISPAIDYALHGETLIGDEDKLSFCYVPTDARTKYDKTLQIFLADKKPDIILPAKRIKKDKRFDELQTQIKNNSSVGAVPVTLLIGTVGAGKSTYLSHFELIQAKDLLREKQCYWVYIDFEKMGKTNPRAFIYQTLKNFTLNEHPYINTDFKGLIEPAYEEEIKKLARGPFGLASKNKEKFEEKIQEIIEADYEKIEPYVDKLISYISQKHLCVIVLDNIDLYENSQLEVEVFSEGIALTKKLHCNVIVSIRDTTYVKHKNESIFNAHELKKLWIDPPPFREVLSKRLRFASTVLKGKKATVPYNHLSLTIEDLSVFFDIAQTTLLSEKSARLIESLADGNIRKGITLVSNFLTSAHIQADRALYNYLNKKVVKGLPFHEVFKGSILGQYKYFKEERAEAINILNSGFNSKSLQLLRVYVLKYLFFRAKDKNTIETDVKKIAETFSQLGASENHIIELLSSLYLNKLVRSIDSKEITSSSVLVITLSGGYYYKFLLRQFEYLETVLYDTPIFLDEYWEQLHPLNEEINHEGNIIERVKKRRDRSLIFFEYLKAIEREGIKRTTLAMYSVCEEIEPALKRKLDYVVSNAIDNYG